VPSEPRSLRKWIRVACLSVHAPLSLLALLAVLASGPVACASHPSPDALAATRDTLASLDDFGALLLGAGFLLRHDGFLAAALTGEPARWVGPVVIRDRGAGAFEMGEFYTRADGDSWRRADRPNLDRL